MKKIDWMKVAVMTFLYTSTFVALVAMIALHEFIEYIFS